MYRNMQHGHLHISMDMDMDMGLQHVHGHAAFPFYSLRIIFVSLHSLQIIFVFASIRFKSYLFRMPNFLIRFETNRSESNPLIRYFANIYSLPDSLYSLRSEYEGTPYLRALT
jgi:hypothetical protein